MNRFSASIRNAVVSSLLLVGVSSSLILTGCGTTQTREDHRWSGSIAGKGATLAVEGLGCPMCAESIHVLLDGVDGVADSHVDLETGIVAVDFKPGASVSKAALAAAVTDGGFSLRAIEPMGD